MAAVLRMIGVDAELGRRAKPAPTAVAAAAALDCEQGAIADSVVFDTAGKPLLALASGAHRVDTKKLAQRLETAKMRRPALTLSSSTPISVRAASPRSDTLDQSCPAAGSPPETFLGVPKSSSSLKCAPVVINVAHSQSTGGAVVIVSLPFLAWLCRVCLVAVVGLAFG